jgi:sigma-E factor negative regulatory protein RseB
MLKQSLIALLFWCWTAQAFAAAIPDRTPDQWLAHMNRAFAELNYDGVFSYFNGTDLATLRIVHLVRDGIEHERLVHLNGAPREILRTGDDVVCFLQPGDKLLEFENSIPSGPFARAFSASFERVSDHYELTLSESDRVADREAVRLAISPVDSHRYGYRLWLDSETGLLLRSELVDREGNRLEIFQFTTIRINDDIDPSVLEPETADNAVTTHISLDTGAAPRESSGEMRWEASWVPDGFRMAAWDIRRAPATLNPVNTLMYSDELAAFSVFIETMPDRGGSSLVSRDGATVAVTAVVPGPNDAPAESSYLVTVVGEVPTDTALRVARSVRYRAGP